jgi:hypothetical protein
MRFAKIVFRIAGIWGLLVIMPLYFLFDIAGRQSPPAINHPEFYFSFVGVTLVWQIAFFVIASNPIRFRPFMIVAMLEKLGYILTVSALYLQHRVASNQLIWVGTDSTLCLLFVASYFKTPATSQLAEKLQ